ncbi:hypothetical protein D3C81_1722530 [compost metagenome]
MQIDHAFHIEKRKPGNPPRLRPLRKALQRGLDRRCQQTGGEQKCLPADIIVIVPLQQCGQLAGVGLTQQQLTDIQQPS